MSLPVPASRAQRAPSIWASPGSLQALAGRDSGTSLRRRRLQGRRELLCLPRCWPPSPVLTPCRPTGLVLLSLAPCVSTGTANPGLPPQVAMGYSHSLVIARDESEAEKEKLKRLPEYNPRTL